MVITWIKCSDRLPKSDEWVLVYVPGLDKKMHVGYLESEQLICFEIGAVPRDCELEYFTYHATHWAELPEMSED